LLEDTLAQPLKAPVVWWMGIRPLLAAMLMESGEYGKARTVLHWPRAGRDPEVEAPDSGLVRVFRERLAACLAEDTPEGIMPEAPASTGRDTPPFPALNRLLEKQRARAFASTDTSWPRLEELPIPRCRNASACASCTCRKYCFVDEWHRLALTLRAIAHPLGTQGLLNLLSP
jgi:hypothetical protein